MKYFWKPLNVAYFLIFTLIANSYLLLTKQLWLLILFIPAFLGINLFGGFFALKTKSIRFRFCHHGGVMLCIFLLSLLPSAAWHIYLGIKVIPENYMTFVWSAVICILTSAVLFWNGIVCVYLTSTQLGIKWRVIGALCGMIPIANLFALNKLLVVMEEVDTELTREALNASRKEDRVCATKYPVLLVHGVFFRDSKFFNYWGRVPKELEKNGAVIYYGNHQSALSVEESAEELKARILEIVSTTGCEKVNIIAHSKGGLDCRYAISELGVAPYVASLTTVNTPHRGCLFADKLLYAAPEGMKEKVALVYNTALRRLGDANPDFLKAVSCLTSEACAAMNEKLTMPDGIYCASVGSKLNKAKSGQFPLNLSYHLVKAYDGENDGLVGVDSFAFGEDYRLITVKGKRGVSHGDMIDLNRENIKGFDVREFYVEMLADLKKKGL